MRADTIFVFAEALRLSSSLDRTAIDLRTAASVYSSKGSRSSTTVLAVPVFSPTGIKRLPRELFYHRYLYNVLLLA